MGWGRLDDGLDGNEKFANLSLAATGLWLKCLPRALRNDDGFVPRNWARNFTNARGFGGLLALSTELMGAGLWEETEGGWIIHDFEKYVSPRSNSAERVRRYRERKAQGLAVVTEVKRVTRDVKRTHAGARASGYPEPVPEPVSLLPSVVEPERGVTKSGEIERVYRAWVASLPPGTARSLTDARRDKVRARLRSFPVDDLLDAVQGWQNDPWPDRVNQNDLTILLRSDEQCEKFRDLWRNGAPEPMQTTNPVSRAIQGFTAFSDAEARGERL